jgi:RNA polymerase sigma factor (TIGR02999 family)
MSDVTQILAQIQDGNTAAAEQLFPLVYGELRKLAAAKLAREKRGQTLLATALVHEAYVRLVGGSGEPQQWDSRGHFFAAAAESMRRILVDNARRKRTEKHGGGLQRIELRDRDLVADQKDVELPALDEALRKLEQHDRTKAELVKLRYFAGLTNAQAAESLGIGVSTAIKYWSYARCWLKAEIDGNTGSEEKSEKNLRAP